MFRAALAASLALVAAGCGGDDLGTASVALEGSTRTTTVEVEVADSEDERRQGLKGREELAPGTGMVFLFEQPVTSRFVMEDTLIPLSIAFADEDGRIVTIRDMDPCREEPCPTYASRAPFTVALEVAQGAFERWGIEVGDRLRVEPRPG
jgi:uncharacterized protein